MWQPEMILYVIMNILVKNIHSPVYASSMFFYYFLNFIKIKILTIAKFNQNHRLI